MEDEILREEEVDEIPDDGFASDVDDLDLQELD